MMMMMMMMTTMRTTMKTKDTLPPEFQEFKASISDIGPHFGISRQLRIILSLLKVATHQLS